MAEQLGRAELVLELNDTALRQGLEDLKRDIANVSATLNPRSTGGSRRSSGGGFGAASRDNFGSTPATVRDIFDDDLARVRAARVREEKTAADITRLTAQSEQRAARAFATASAERTRRLKEATSNAVIGGAFPALFGQGAGASIGGGLGGGIGGLIGGQFGFGLSLVGTAVGQRFDEISRALENPIANFDALKTAGLLSSRAVEKNVEALIQLGRASEANAIIQRELGNRFSSQEEAKAFDEAIGGVNRAFSEASFVVGKFVAGPLADFLAKLRNSGNPNKSVPEAGLTAAENRQRLTDNSNTLINTGTGFAAAGLALAPTGVGAPVALGLLATGSIMAGVGAATRPGAPDPRGTQANMDREFKLAQQQQISEQRQTELRQLRLQLVSAEAQGQQELALTLQRQTLELEKQAALEDSRARKESPAKQQAISAQFNEQLLRIDERRLELERQRTREVRTRADVERRAEAALQQLRADFAVSLRQAQNSTARAGDNLFVQRRRTSEGFGNLGEQAFRASFATDYAKQELEVSKLAQTAAEVRAVNAQREALILGERVSTLQKEGASYSQITDAIEAAKQAALQAESAKNDYTLAGEALKEAGINVATSAFKAKNEFKDLLRSAEDAVKNITRGLQDSILQLQEAQNTSNTGLNEFLSPNQVARQQSAIAAQLAPLAQEIAARRGIRFELEGGTRESRNAALIRFIRADRQQTRLSEDIAKSFSDLGTAQADISIVNERLAKVNSDLYEATVALAQKDWAVNVAVNANTGAYAVQLG